jgi:hypothetical protein
VSFTGSGLHRGPRCNTCSNSSTRSVVREPRKKKKKRYAMTECRSRCVLQEDIEKKATGGGKLWMKRQGTFECEPSQELEQVLMWMYASTDLVVSCVMNPKNRHGSEYNYLCLAICVFACMSVCLSVCVCVCVCVCVSVCRWICLTSMCI